MKKYRIKHKNRGVHEHLEHTLRFTSYADRLKWLEESYLFVRKLQKKKGYPNLPNK